MSGEAEAHERPDDSGRLVFPDAPRLELDELLTQIIVRAEEVPGHSGQAAGPARRQPDDHR
jgi:hypothetical protein